jgi:effector-binding domain-containing protein
MSDYGIITKLTESLRVISVVGSMQQEGEFWQTYKHTWTQLKSQINVLKLDTNGVWMTIFHMPVSKEDDITIEAVYTTEADVSESSDYTVKTLESAIQMASTIHYGSQKTVKNAYIALLDWIKAQGYETDGPYREIYHDMKDAKIEIQVSFKKA